MINLDTIHVAIATPEAGNDVLVETIAAASHKSSGEIRNIQSKKIPGIVAHFPTIEKAEELVRSLKSLGIIAFSCKQSDLLRASARSFKAYNLIKGPDTIVFHNNANKELTLKISDIFLIIQGTSLSKTIKESTESKMKFSISKTLMIGGIPMWDKVEKTKKEVAVQTQRFLRLYNRTSSDACVEIVQNNFDYSFLGKEMTLSSLANINLISAKIRNMVPDVFYNDGLIRSLEDNPSPDSDDDGLEVNCKLIYLYYREIPKS
jgi:hypothetical protein